VELMKHGTSPFVAIPTAPKPTFEREPMGGSVFAPAEITQECDCEAGPASCGRAVMRGLVRSVYASVKGGRDGGW